MEVKFRNIDFRGDPEEDPDLWAERARDFFEKFKCIMELKVPEGKVNSLL